MTEIIVKNNIDRQKLDSAVDANIPFAESFGMWAGRDINVREIRQKAYEKRCMLSNEKE